MKRIWTRKELTTAYFGKFDKDGDFIPFKESYCITKDMFGKSVKWCKENKWAVRDWMIAKPTQQEPKEGDLVYVWEENERPITPMKAIFLAKVKYGCVCAFLSNREEYKKGLKREVRLWKNYEPIPKLTAQEIADKVGLTVDELRGIVNG